MKGLRFLDSFLCLTQYSMFKELARGADRVGFLQKFNRFIKKPNRKNEWLYSCTKMMRVFEQKVICDLHKKLFLLLFNNKKDITNYVY